MLSLGHITNDLLTDGSDRPGGTATFAADTALALNEIPAVISSATRTSLLRFTASRPAIGLVAEESPTTTTFINRYTDGFRVQYLNAHAQTLRFRDIPQSWLTTPIVLFGPVAQEIPLDLILRFPRRQGQLLAATPQGWLRRWDTVGRVWPTPWQEADQILPHLDALILSHDDLLPFVDEDRAEVNKLLLEWSMRVPLLVVTDGRQGATLFQHGRVEHFAAYPAHEADPTGAGDVFATAFLIELARHHDPRTAVNFANCVAACSIEAEGSSGLPTLAQVQQRIRPL